MERTCSHCRLSFFSDNICYNAADSLAADFRPVQLWVGTTLVCEAAVFAAHECTSMTNLKSTPTVYAKVDVRNAINTVRRDKMLKSVQERCPEIYHRWLRPLNEISFKLVVFLRYHYRWTRQHRCWSSRKSPKLTARPRSLTKQLQVRVPCFRYSIRQLTRFDYGLEKALPAIRDIICSFGPTGLASLRNGHSVRCSVRYRYSHRHCVIVSVDWICIQPYCSWLVIFVRPAFNTSFAQAHCTQMDPGCKQLIWQLDLFLLLFVTCS